MGVILFIIVILLIVYFIMMPNNNPEQTDIELWFVTYGDTPFYDKARTRITKSAMNTGWFHHIDAYTQHNLTAEFRNEFGDILKQKRGGGYWIWRFDVLQDVMAKMRDGDILVFLDAGCRINKNGTAAFDEYVEMLKQSPHQMLAFQLQEKPERVWTTDKVFAAFDVSSSDEIRNTEQMAATYLMIQKGRLSEEWLSYILQVLRSDPWIITDRYNGDTKRTRSDFKDNRHDQSLMSVSRKIKGTAVTLLYRDGNQSTPFWDSRWKSK